ncbi:hypothetical protein BDZ89DRAFT_121502 [Hymenopellis radicata]|nr:hypothetical protein BDZ89DRAFT_121502 [Hymenopellis radicata]
MPARDTTSAALPLLFPSLTDSGRCSVSSLVVLGAAIGADGTGISESLNMIWHQPAKMYTFTIIPTYHVSYHSYRATKLRVLSNSVYIHGRIRTARCEIWDREKDKLYVSAVHSTVNNTRPKL